MQVHLTRDEIEVAVGNYIRVMFVQAVTVTEIKVEGSGQRITAEVEMVSGDYSDLDIEASEEEVKSE